MRISENERIAIINEARIHFGQGTKVILFGSRSDDQAKGGDIDLLVIPSNSDLDFIYKNKINFLVHLKNAIDDQKIDVIIKQPGDNRRIIATALEEGIALC